MNMDFKRKLPIPMETKEMYPVSPAMAAAIEVGRGELKAIFGGQSDKLVLIIGPCSADNEDSVMDYLTRLAGVAEQVADRIRIVSGERIAVELNKIMLAPHPSIGFEYLQRSGLLQIILPEVAALDIVERRDGRAHKNNFYHSLEVLENVCKNV